MSFTDRLVLWLHIAFAIFTIGPVTLAISSFPRYLRDRDVAILRYLARITTIFTVGSLLVLIAGIILGQLNHDFSRPWLTASMTLFLVAIVLLVLIMRDQRRAIKALTPDGDPSPAPVSVPAQSGGSAPDQDGAEPAGEAAGPSRQLPEGATIAEHVASVERGRIAALGGVVNLIWLVILILMVWQPQ